MTGSTFFFIRATIYITSCLLAFKYLGYTALFITFTSLALLEIAYRGLGFLAEEILKVRAVVIKDLETSGEGLKEEKTSCSQMLGDLSVDEVIEFADNPQSENAIDEFLLQLKPSEEVIQNFSLKLKRDIVEAVAEQAREVKASIEDR